MQSSSSFETSVQIWQFRVVTGCVTDGSAETVLGNAVYAHEPAGLVTAGPLSTGKVVPEQTQPGVLIP